MFSIKILAIGKQKEPHLLPALETYERRLTPFCRLSFLEIPAQRLPENPSPKEIAAALAREAKSAERLCEGTLIALCIEGKTLSSEAFSAFLTETLPARGACATFLLGSSYGLDASLKSRADYRLSLSPMTFPHALASVMLLEQCYRAFLIARGSKYHK